MLGQLFVPLHELHPKLFLFADFEALARIYESAALYVDGPADFVDAKVPSLVVLEEFLALRESEALHQSNTTGQINEIYLFLPV